jgi:hypothetical protein
MTISTTAGKTTTAPTTAVTPVTLQRDMRRAAPPSPFLPSTNTNTNHPAQCRARGPPTFPATPVTEGAALAPSL